MTNRIVLRMLFVAACGWATAGQAAEEDALKNIVLVAGLKSHGAEGNGVHDYAWSVRLIQTMLENSDIAPQVRVTSYLNGWPADRASFESADTIMIISDGRQGDRGRLAPHLANTDRVELIDQQIRRGCGFVTFHFSTFAPQALADHVLRWSGGYVDWSADGSGERYSGISTLEALVRPADAHHPILRGVEPFTMREEFCFDVRFRPNDPRWTPIWTVDAIPATRPHGQVVGWAVERVEGGRAFSTTCGHFYDNWELPAFRKTILNAVAWTAHVTVPDRGLESPFFTKQEIAAHLLQPDLISSLSEEREDIRYADEPYWYKPGHPTKPAEAATVVTQPGFKAARVMSVPEEFGSWTALCVDPEGRLIAAAQHRPGLYRLTPPAIHDEGAECRVERLTGAAMQVGWSQGLLYAFDSLYVTVSEQNDTTATGVYRLRDRDGDDQFDEVRRIIDINASGEHGPHNIVVGPDRQRLYMICGNGTELPAQSLRRRPVATEGIDHLMPPGFTSSEHTMAGWVGRFRPDGSDLEVFCGGLRNSYDLAFNQRGDLFTFDSDMELDLGTPWYRPTRICHLVSGGEFGWRAGAAKWPEYYEDSVAPVLNIGPASPTGLVFGYGSKFPAKYQHALFACDWTFATIHAIHLTPSGGSYTAEVEEFAGGRGLPVTDVVIGGDGAMYFAVGGRRLGSAIYRIHYEGREATVRADSDTDVPELHVVRRGLDNLHGRPRAGSVGAAWPHLGRPDRAIRFAARVALETQDTDEWRDLAHREPNLDCQLTALLALARQGSADDCRDVLNSLNRIELAGRSATQLLRALRAYEMALARSDGRLDSGSTSHLPHSLRKSIAVKLGQLFPHQNAETKSVSSYAAGQAAAVDRELSRLLCYLDHGPSIDSILQLMAADSGQRPVLGSGYFVRNPKYGHAVKEMLQAAPLVDRMHHAQMLLWMKRGWTAEQRRDYYTLSVTATQVSRGGNGYEDFWKQIGDVVWDQIPAAERLQLESVRASRIADESENVPRPRGPGKNWTLDEMLELAEDRLSGRNFANGRRMFVAAQCATCHRFNGEGNIVGPDLSTIAQRFTIRDILDSTIHPSKVVSDQFRITMITLSDGVTLSGRIVSRDSRQIQLANNLMRPSQLITVPTAEIDEELPVPVSTMPTRLLDPLNADEVLDLLSYLVSGGNPNHELFGN